MKCVCFNVLIRWTKRLTEIFNTPNAFIIKITKSRLVLLLITIITLIARLTERVSEVLFVLLFLPALLEGTRLETKCTFQLVLKGGFKLLTLSEGIKKKLQRSALPCCFWLVVKRGKYWIINLQALEKSDAMFYFLALDWASNVLLSIQTHNDWCINLSQTALITCNHLMCCYEHKYLTCMDSNDNHNFSISVRRHSAQIRWIQIKTRFC